LRKKAPTRRAWFRCGQLDQGRSPPYSSVHTRRLKT
jgi:hypothetical protein